MSAMEICSETRVGHWEFANTLGEGAYGEVKLAINQRTQETCAVKIISLNLLEDRTAIQKEVLIHKTLNHVNIIRYISSFQQLDKFYIVLEYASGGELFDRIEPDYGMNMNVAHHYFVQLINGIEYLHSKGIVHRDLKPENLLLNDADQIKIADFGLATLFQYRGNERLLTSPCGTAPYVAPEVITKKEYKAQPTDIWSCGIVLVAMLAGELPWDKPVMECADFVSWVRDNNYQKSPWCKIENTALSLLRNILIYDPTQRFNIRQIKQSTWFVKAHKTPTYDQLAHHHAGLNTDKSGGGDSFGFLSQPTYFYLSTSSGASSNGNGSVGVTNVGIGDDMDSMQSTNGISMMSSQLEVTDSQQACECSQQVAHGGANMTAATTNHRQPFESFSQPISIDDMYLNSQAMPTQNQTQASQNPLFKLVKRMTRMFVHLDLDACTTELKSLCEKFMYDSRVCDINARQRQLTVVTRDRRQTLLTFKVNIIDMTNGPTNEVLVDFRLSKGDGLEFKRIFMKFKQSLTPVVCRRYVFVNSHACCENKRA